MSHSSRETESYDSRGSGKHSADPFSKGSVLVESEIRIGGEDVFCRGERVVKNVHITFEVSDLKFGQAVLSVADKVARASELEVLFCDFEAVGGF